MIEHDFAHPISTFSSFSLLAITILAARSNISITLEPVRAEHSAKVTASISCCSSIISLYLKKVIMNFQKISSHFASRASWTYVTLESISSFRSDFDATRNIGTVSLCSLISGIQRSFTFIKEKWWSYEHKSRIISVNKKILNLWKLGPDDRRVNRPMAHGSLMYSPTTVYARSRILS